MKIVTKIFALIVVILLVIFLFDKPKSVPVSVEASTITTITTITTEVIHEPFNDEYTTKEEQTTEVTTEVIKEIIVDQEWVEKTETTTEEILSPVLSYNTSVKSNLTEEQLNYLLKNSNMAGMGDYFKFIEDEFGVSSLFAISVAMTETTLGQYGVANSHNNAFGLTSPFGGFMDFDSIEGSILYFGGYIPRVQWKNGRYYIGDIAESYCDAEWGDTVEYNLNYFYEKLEGE